MKHIYGTGVIYDPHLQLSRNFFSTGYRPLVTAITLETNYQSLNQFYAPLQRLFALSVPTVGETENISLCTVLIRANRGQILKGKQNKLSEAKN